jgi:hypothetical protein
MEWNTLAGAAASMADPAVLFAQNVTDIDILRFAMNLEWLEAEFYTVATTGRTLEQSGFNVAGDPQQGHSCDGRAYRLD